MPRRKPVMSEALKIEIARELGIYDVVQNSGFGEVSSRNCGNLVKLAVQRAERALVNNPIY